MKQKPPMDVVISGLKTATEEQYNEYDYTHTVYYPLDKNTNLPVYINIHTRHVWGIQDETILKSLTQDIAALIISNGVH